MTSLLEKVAQELEKAADIIQTLEAKKAEESSEETKKKEDEDKKKKEEAEAKKEAALKPIRESLGELDKLAEEKLNSTSIEVLEMMSKTLAKASEKTASSSSSDKDDWGNIEGNKGTSSKSAGYLDPVQAFCARD